MVVPRVARAPEQAVGGEPGVGERRSVRLADHDGAGRPQPGDDQAVRSCGWGVGQPVTSHRGGHAGDVDQVLHQDRKPGERTARVDPLGVCERLLRTQCNHGVQRWVVGLDAPQRLGDQLPGVQLARSNPLDQLGPHRNLPLVEQ